MAQESAPGRPNEPVRFDALMALLGLWFVGGLYLDGWAHTHRPGLESFFTPWHAVLYGGFLANALVLGALFARHRLRRVAWSHALPRGYGLSLLGAGLFLLGGAADLAWHELFGIEATIEALVSPTHLLLAVGMGLLVSGPLRSAWHRLPERPGFLAALPMLLSAALLLSVITFFTQFAHPFVRAWAADGNRPLLDLFPLADPDPRLPESPAGIPGADLAEAIGLVGFAFQAALLAGLVLALARRWSLPAGSLTVLVGLNGALLAGMRGQLFVLPVALLAGLLADGALRAFAPAPARPGSMRLFGFALPALLYGLYFAALAWLTDLWWPPHAWAGAVAYAGLAGWLASYVAVPARPADA